MGTKMKCKICGRALKNVKSREAGYGPVCYRKKFGANIPIKRRESTLSAGKVSYCEVPGQMQVYDYLRIIGAR